MFETTTILASDRLGRWGRIIAVSAVMLGPWFTPTVQADVATPDIRLFLSDAIQPPPSSIDFSQDVAVKQVLQGLLNSPNGSFDAPFAKRLGFDLPIPDQALIQNARSSFPIAVFRIGLKRLREFIPGELEDGNPLKLLAADANWLVNLPPPLPPGPTPSRFLFPITVRKHGADVVQSSVRLQAIWSPSSLTPPKLDFEIERFGSSMLIRLIDKWRRDPSPPREINPHYFLVWIPALDRYYLGRARGFILLITAITDDRRVGLRGGEEADAREVFNRLKVEALTIDADDPDAPPR